MLNKNEATEVMNDIVQRIDGVMEIIRSFEESRPGSIAFTKLEEAIMWLNVMVHHVPQKPVPDCPIDAKKEEVVEGAFCAA